MGGLTFIDFLVVVLYFAILFGIALYTRKKASGSTSDFFLSGRSATWWLAGTSMVATTFAADTPLAVTELVAKNGIAGNWIWWSMVFSGMLTVFFYAKLWRRSGVLTDVEFAEIRYTGKPAAFLRGFRALYLGLPINIIIMGWVNLAMITILQETLAIEKNTAVLICICLMIIAASFTSLSGLAGLLVIDFFQFILKMGVVIILAVFAINAIGGIGSLKEKLTALDPTQFPTESVLSFTPDLNSLWMPMITFFVYIAVNWWASWYPGAEPGGGGYIAQRIFSAKDERHSILATLWFNIAHYAVRPWPWVLVALVAMVQLQSDPEFIANPRVGYVRMMMMHMPDYLRGLMLAGFLAAFLSTISSSLNWGTSLIVNDFYRRFLVKDKDEKYYVKIARISTILLMIISAIASLFMDSISGAWKFLIAIGAGTGLVFILRWFWWRINAWSEVSAMLCALIISLILQFGFKMNTEDPKGFAYMVLITTSITTIFWLTVTLLTKPEPQEKLLQFYRKVRPSAALWKPIAKIATDIKPEKDGMFNLVDWLLGCLLIYMTLFGVGQLILGDTIWGIVFLIVAIICLFYIYRDLTKRGWESLSK